MKKTDMKKIYTKKQIVEAIAYWEKLLKLGNYRRICEKAYNFKDLKDQCDQIVKLLPKLRKARQTVTDLFKRGKVKFSDTGRRSWQHRRDFYYPYNKFITDGWFHNPGFNGTRDRLFGIEGGGASGSSLYVDIDTGEFTIRDDGEDLAAPDVFAEKTDSRGRPFREDWDITHHADRLVNEIGKYVEMVERAAAGEDIYSWDRDDPYGEEAGAAKTFTVDYTAWHKDKYQTDVEAKDEAEAKKKFLAGHPEEYDFKGIEITSIKEK